jgi:tetratricopeptide (TPR) repeat protein
MGLSVIDLERAMALCIQELAFQRTADDPEALAVVLHSYGRLLLDAGDYGQARLVFDEALAIWQEQDLQFPTGGGTARVLYDLGRAHWLQGDLEAATMYYDESLRLLREADANEWISLVQADYGYTMLCQHDSARAAECFRESLHLLKVAGQPDEVCDQLAGMAAVADSQGDVPRAARLFGAAARFAESGYLRTRSEWLAYEQLMTTARARLHDPLFAAAFAEGQTMTLESAISFALATE